MDNFLDYQFSDTPAFVNTFDELPLWSASFGLLLLKHLELRREISVLDIGSGTGFPVIELAQRLGSSCKVVGLDPWQNANQRARLKMTNYGIDNVEIIDGSAEEIPFPDQCFDMVVSNLGINNFTNPGRVLDECHRALKPGGSINLTTNLNGHWGEFYHIFEQTAKQLGAIEVVEKLTIHQEHRGTVTTISRLLEAHGFHVRRFFNESLEMKFNDGTAFLNHHFVKLGWVADWKATVPSALQREMFTKLEQNLNQLAAAAGGLSMYVPMLFIEGVKTIAP